MQPDPVASCGQRDCHLDDAARAVADFVRAGRQYRRGDTAFDQVLSAITGCEGASGPAMQALLAVVREALTLESQAGQARPTCVRGDAQLPLDNQKVSPCVRQVLAYMLDHFEEHLTWREIARTVCRHQAYIATIFRRETGMTMRQYLRALRVRRAAELVAAGEKVDVAMMTVGYRSKRTFYQHFRRDFGATPGQYREARNNS